MHNVQVTAACKKLSHIQSTVSYCHGKVSRNMYGRGVLSGKVGTLMCGPDGVLFRPLRFTNGPFFYLKIGLDIGRVFAKCI